MAVNKYIGSKGPKIVLKQAAGGQAHLYHLRMPDVYRERPFIKLVEEEENQVTGEIMEDVLGFRFNDKIKWTPVVSEALMEAVVNTRTWPHQVQYWPWQDLAINFEAIVRPLRDEQPGEIGFHIRSRYRIARRHLSSEYAGIYQRTRVVSTN